MSVRLLAKAFYTDLPPHLKLTLLALCDEASEDGTGISIGQKRLAAKVGGGERTVRRNLEALRDQGWLIRLPEKHARYRTDQYEIVVERLPERPAIMAGASSAGPDTGDAGTGHPRPPAPDTGVLLPKGLPVTDTQKELAPRKRDAIWDVLVEVYGDPTDASRKLRGLNVKVLRDYGADPDEIREFVTVMAGTDRDWSVTTPSALAKHYGERLALMAQVQNPRKRKVGQSAELLRQAMGGER